MANTRDTEGRRAYATVDTGPASPGYFTDEVSMKRESRKRLFFSVRDMGTGFSATVALQFRCIGDDDWTDYDTYTYNTRKVLDGEGEHVLWRAGVKNGSYTSGKVRFGFDW